MTVAEWLRTYWELAAVVGGVLLAWTAVAVGAVLAHRARTSNVDALRAARSAALSERTAQRHEDAVRQLRGSVENLLASDAERRAHDAEREDRNR